MYGYIVQTFVIVAVVVGILNAALILGKDFLAKYKSRTFKTTYLTSLIAKFQRKFFKETYVDEDNVGYGLVVTAIATGVVIALGLVWPIFALAIPVGLYLWWNEHQSQFKSP